MKKMLKVVALALALVFGTTGSAYALPAAAANAHRAVGYMSEVACDILSKLH